MRKTAPPTDVTTDPVKEAVRLTREDWLQAAFNAVVEGGVEHLKVLTLADTLKVTRGSFYWHFADHAELVQATLARWKEQEMQRILRIQSHVTDDPHADMSHLLDAALAHGGEELENMRFELAVRGLGRRDPQVALLLHEIDQARTQLFVRQFERLLGDAKKAQDLAVLFYLSIVGCYQALSRPSSPARAKDYFKAIITSFLIQAQLPPTPNH